MDKMIKSTVLPKLTFIRPPRVGPSRCATLPVAKVKRTARGMIATALSAKDDIWIDFGEMHGYPCGDKNQ